MGKSKQNKKNVNKQTAEKIVTRYDRKMEARRLQREKEERIAKYWKIGSLAVVVCAVCIAVGLVIRSIVEKQSALKDTYLTIGDHEMTKLEYDYFYSSTVNNYINTYYSYLSYMGLDLTKDFSKQAYNENLTWKDNFDKMTVDTITEIKAMHDDAQAQGFEYDVTEDYNSYLEDVKNGASQAELSLPKYYQASFGQYATQSNVESFIKEMLYSNAYYNHLKEIMAPSEEEITSYYEENKNNYDKVSYHVFQFNAELEEDSTEEAITAAMKELNTKADEMAKRLKAGEDFNTLCKEYAPEDQKENYNNSETEYSFHQNSTYYSISSQYAEWLYEEDRQKEELTKVEDTENHVIYVVRFDERIYDESCRDTISERLASQEVTEYVNGIKESYEVTDVKGDLNYLVNQETTTIAEDTSSQIEEDSSENKETT